MSGGLKTRSIVVMGVTACGKSTVGAALADRLGLKFTDGDALHPPGNIEKMEAGMPLSDEDRLPWLERVGETLAKAGDLVVGCSALKRAYRDLIRERAGKDVAFIHLTGARDLLASRMSQRTGHFMPSSLLDSQLETLESPQADEFAVSIDIDALVDEIVGQAEAFLRGS